MKKISALVLAAATLAPSFTFAHEAGDVLFRAGTATVRPNAGSDNVLGLGSFDVNNNTQLGLTFGYMITDNIGVELLAATPFQHRVSLPGAGEIAEVKHLPPTLMAQYYFGSAENKLRPYVGIGVNYTTFFSEKFNDNAAVRSVNLNSLDLKDSWGVAGQVGLDYKLDKNWMLNTSLWWMNIETDVKFKTGNIDHEYKTRLDPWVFMFGVGYSF
ncbi:outer membrane protein OmpW [Xenorhabdus nematophila]|uniref:Outer membrane protein W n=1 Tax=Xenorhabdus nematophila (strain ATCC 19061 / DSM 3370 / CCUG 14189 / LMG 1036 / NCIMB 9965 / AN6) TaxID=406817 RepID=D3VGR2_XENNA|nr:outer membrane protein OmpW [Xenorhabdus nematophila]CEE90029.1 putative outer membrane protein W; colicin S4 receptor; transport protein [Xenorhabdus nematophila str. Anatoliense]CEF32867.1 putative outer membrane protein W; colicin S4 receptor; transport protein [Xenorhabdus nematophila str. Websteri]AYA40135.1 outer membrane protein OmpW [Xenorhabdus nematophila]KHD28287.1 membrane protein [Xenorhabdus nematophila]MBA0018784.1 outer membrane protein OmpW [Xenorhabdus nematophila]